MYPQIRNLSIVFLVLTSSWLHAGLSGYDAAIEADNAGATPYVTVSREIMEFDGTAGIEFDFGEVDESSTIEFIVSGDPEAAQDGFLAVGENGTWNLRYEQWDDTSALGFTHLGVADYLFDPVDDVEPEALDSPTEPSHVTYRWDQASATMELYLNGELVGTNVDATDYEMPTGIGFLGAKDADGGEGMTGTIERVTVYNNAIDPATISFHASAWLGNSDPGVVLGLIQDFGELPFIGQAQTLIITIRNSGQENDLTLDATITEGTNFTIISAPSVIPPGGAGEIELQFDRQGAIGQFSGTMEVTTNDPDEFDQTITVDLRASLIDREGPYAHYRLDEAAGVTTMPDATGFGRNGTYTAGVTLGAEALASGTAMEVGGGSRASIPGDQFGGLDEFTLSLWVNPTDVTGLQTLIGKGDDTSPTFAIIADGGALQWFVDLGPGFSTDAAVLTSGMTHHVAAVYTSTKATLYVDGVAVAIQDDPLTFEILEANPFLIGSFNTALPFAGRIDDVQIYDRALTDAQVQGLHDSPGSVVTGELSEKPLIAAQWSFDSTLSDTAPGGFGDVLTPTGDPDYVAGVVGEAIRITADGLQRLRAPDSDDLELAADWTLEAFVWPDADNIGEWDRLWTKWGDGGEQWHVSFRSTGAVDVANGLDLFINGGPNVINSNDTAEVPLETWSHIAFIGDSAAGTITAWLNGVQVGSTDYQAIEPGDGAMNFGNFESPANELQYSGLIDEAIIHAVARDASYLLERTALIPEPIQQNGGVPRDGFGWAAGLSQPLKEPTVVDFGALSGDATYEFSFNATKLAASTAFAGNNTWAFKLEQWQDQGIFGITEFGVADHTFDPVDGKSVDSVFEGDVHVAVVNDTAAAETRLYVNGEHVGSWAGNFELAGEGSVLSAGLAADRDLFGEDSIMHGWATYNSALTDENIAVLAVTPFGAPPSETLAALENVSISETGAFTFTIPQGVTGNLEYSRDLLNWEVIGSDLDGAVEDSEATRNAEPSGYYRLKQ